MVRLFKQLESFLGIEIEDLEEDLDDEKLDQAEAVGSVFDVDDEIAETINKDLIPLQDRLDKKNLNLSEAEEEDNNENDNENDEYNLIDGHKIIETLEFEIGSSKVPRFSCVLHKLNIALRKSIKKTKTLTNVLKKLSGCASEIRMSVAKSKVFQKKIELEMKIKLDGYLHF